MSKIYFSDFHSNMHSAHINEEFEYWLDFAKEMLDFWAPVYYPYRVNGNAKQFYFEDTNSKEKYNADYALLKKQLQEKSGDFITYPAYEWQGSGSDGDHNVFSQDFENEMHMPLEYSQLVEECKGENVIGIPHHTAYMPKHRGKNWDTHNAAFSPVTEIYSSHGSSEEGDATIPLNVHIHMGPRTDGGSALAALKRGIEIGFIASGDNHCHSAIAGNGFFGVIAENYDRKSIFEGIKNRHTYAVSRNRMKMDFKINGAIMGDKIKPQPQNALQFKCEAGSAIDRIELYQNGVIRKIYPHSGSYERKKLQGKVKFKFEIELGWGPDRRVFPEIYQKLWDLKVETTGEILSVEKLFTSPGSVIERSENQVFQGKILSQKDIPGQSKLSQKNYATPHIQNQSLIFEIEDDIDSVVEISIDGKKAQYKIRDMLFESRIVCLEEESRKLLATRDFTEFYREDPWWHNAYKAVLHKAYTKDGYFVEIADILERENPTDNYFVKVIQKNGECGWTSPIYISDDIK